MWILPAKPPYVQNFWSGYIDTFGGGRGAEGLLKIFYGRIFTLGEKRRLPQLYSKITDRSQNFGSKLFLNS